MRGNGQVTKGPRPTRVSQSYSCRQVHRPVRLRIRRNCRRCVLGEETAADSQSSKFAEGCPSAPNHADKSRRCTHPSRFQSPPANNQSRFLLAVSRRPRRLSELGAAPGSIHMGNVGCLKFNSQYLRRRAVAPASASQAARERMDWRNCPQLTRTATARKHYRATVFVIDCRLSPMTRWNTASRRMGCRGVNRP